jgi:hypothetical protein
MAEFRAIVNNEESVGMRFFGDVKSAATAERSVANSFVDRLRRDSPLANSPLAR